VIEHEKRGVLVSMPWRRKAGAALGEPLDLTEVPVVAVSPLRQRLSMYVGQHVVVARHSAPVAALVPRDWYVRASTALGEPVSL